MTTACSDLPVAVIGAGPVGLAAAAHLLARGETPLVLEAGDEVGASIRQWSHVRFFSPWKYTVDAASVAMKAVDAKDKDALLLGLDGIDKACESCHLHYWYPKDKRAQEAAKQDGVVE